MITLFKAMLASVAIFAVAVAIVFLIGWFVLDRLGGLVIIYTLSCALFLTLFGGYASGTIAATMSPNYRSVAIAMACSGLIVIAVLGAATAFSIDRDPLAWLLPWMVVVAALRAWRVTQRKELHA